MSPLSASRLLTLSFSALRRRFWLLVPLVVVETLSALLALMPSLLLLARGWVIAKGEWLMLGAGIVAALFEKETLLALLTALLVSLLGAWLLRGFVRAGALGALADALQSRGAEDGEAFARGALEAPERWVAASFVTTFLRAFSSLAIFGSLAASMSLFVNSPGVVAAAAMTASTLLVVLGPLLAAALELAFARAVLLGEGPFEATAGALLLGFRRRAALIPAWASVLLADFAVAMLAASGTTLLSGLGGEELSLQVLMLGPRAGWALVCSAFVALVALVRLGVYAALVLEETGRLYRPPEPRRRPEAPLPPPLPAEPVFEARAVVYEARPLD